MKKLRSRDPSLFDLVLFIGFTISAFCCYLLAVSAGQAGAIAGLALLAGFCAAMIVSR